MSDLTIIIEKGEDGFWVASIPEYPGAVSQGETRQEAREMVIECMQELMAARLELGLKEASHSSVIEKFNIAS